MAVNFYRNLIFNFRTLKHKALAIRGIIRAKGILTTIHINPDVEARATIDEVLRKRFNPKSIEQDLIVKAASDEILAKFKVPNGKPVEQRIESLLNGVLSQSFWFHGQLAGLSTTWELRVRILGDKLGIRPNKPVHEKSKKHRANKTPEHRSLRETIAEINRTTNGHLTLKLVELCDLRDSIIHCNAHALRTYAVQLFGKEVLKPISRGNVFIGRFSTGEMKNLSDIGDEDGAESEDMIAWFLDVFNSGLPKKAFQAFEESINFLNLLSEFHSLCFDERKGIFERIVIEGNMPSSEDIAKFKAYFENKHAVVKRDADVYFSDIASALKNLK